MDSSILNPIKKPLLVKETLDADDDGNGNGIDRISNLPDEILCRILSYLPTDYAAATTFLSTRWKPLFASIPNLRLLFKDDPSLQCPGAGSTASINCVLNVILRDVRSIDTFLLWCGKQHSNAHLSSWICAASRFQIRRVIIIVANVDFIAFPCSFFCCKMLESLMVDGRFILDVPSSVCLPNLQILSFEKVKFCDGDSARRLFNGCSMLKSLIMDGCEFDDLEVHISSPSLKSLTVTHDHHQHGYEFVLDTPLLSSLHYHGYVAESYQVKKMNCLSEVDLDLVLSQEQLGGDPVLYAQTMAQFVALCASTKCLRLSRRLMALLLCFLQWIPTFGNLTVLKLGAIDNYGWKVLPQLLENSTKLEVLVFTGRFCEYDAFADFVARLTDDIPVCLSCHLRVIAFKKFTGGEDEFKVVEYFLKSARVLVNMIISCNLPLEERLSINNKLSALPKCSTTCKILLPEFLWDVKEIMEYT